MSPTIFYNDGNGQFMSTTPLIMSENPFGGALDILFWNRTVYLVNSSVGYVRTEIVKIILPWNEEDRALHLLRPFIQPDPLSLIIEYNGKIVTQNTRYGISVDP